MSQALRDGEPVVSAGGERQPAERVEGISPTCNGAPPQGVHNVFASNSQHYPNGLVHNK